MEKVDGVTNLKVEPQVLVAQVAGAASSSRPQSRGSNNSPDAGPGPAAGGDDAPDQRRQKVGEDLSGSEDRRRRGLGRGEGPRRRLVAPQPADRCLPGPAATVPLKAVADVRIVPAPNEVKREEGVAAARHHLQRSPRAAEPAASVAKDVETAAFKKDADVRAPEYHPEFLGEYAARQESSQRLLALSALLSLVGILLIIHLDLSERQSQEYR